MDIIRKLQEEFGITQSQAENTVRLLDEGNTVPFIARYRKEMTGSLDDQIIRQLSERLTALRNLEDRRTQVRTAIAEQGRLTDALAAKLDAAQTQTEIEDIYRPFRPKRRTRASIAKEKGLQPLADIIWGQKLIGTPEEAAKAFVDSGQGVDTVLDAINGAMDILAEQISDDADLRKLLREETIKCGAIVSKKTKDEPSVYEMYYDYREPLKKAAGHRGLPLYRSGGTWYNVFDTNHKKQQLYRIETHIAANRAGCVRRGRTYERNEDDRAAGPAGQRISFRLRPGGQ